MVLTTLDIIVRRALLEKGYPIHYYNEYLLHASTCLRELALDVLKIVNTKELPISRYGSFDLPEDYSDEVGLFFNAGDRLAQIPHDDNVNPLRVHNTTTGAFEPLRTPSDMDVDAAMFFGGSGWMWFWNINDYGEPTGRFFGAGGGADYGYEIIKERRQGQLTGGFTSGSVILQYISDGQSLDNATQIDVQAFATIRAYQDWKRSRNADNENSPEGRAYYNQRRRLVARLDGTTAEDIKNIFRKQYKATNKN